MTALIQNTVGPVFEARQGAFDAMAVWATDCDTAEEEASRWQLLALHASRQALAVVEEIDREENEWDSK